MSRVLVDSGIKWIGSLPNTWGITTVNKIFYRRKEVNDVENPTVLSLARDGVKIRDISTNEGQLAESYDDYHKVYVNDLMINPMDLISGANCSLSEVEGVISPAYINLAKKADIYPKYYDYFFKYQYWIKAMFIHGKGVSFDNRWTLNWETMASYKLPFPQFEEQKKIAVFLDKECSKIDEIIQENNKEIALLTEYKDTVIEKHIMGRENKYHKLDEPTPWLQQIPNDWIVYKMKHLSNIIMGQSPNGDDIKNSGDTPFMQGNKEFGIKYPNTSLFCDNYKKKSRIGDILMSVRAPVGAINESDKEYGIGRGLCSIRPDSSIIIKDFMKYVLIANKNKFSYYSNGSTFDAITIEALKNLKIMVPSIDVQENIVNTLNKTCSKIDDVIEYRKKIIIKLEEYKKSLIYECVMGKKEV